jgi:hypothetical protein
LSTQNSMQQIKLQKCDRLVNCYRIAEHTLRAVKQVNKTKNTNWMIMAAENLFQIWEMA